MKLREGVAIVTAAAALSGAAGCSSSPEKESVKAAVTSVTDRQPQPPITQQQAEKRMQAFGKMVVERQEQAVGGNSLASFINGSCGVFRFTNRVGGPGVVVINPLADRIERPWENGTLEKTSALTYLKKITPQGVELGVASKTYDVDYPNRGHRSIHTPNFSILDLDTSAFQLGKITSGQIAGERTLSSGSILTLYDNITGTPVDFTMYVDRAPSGDPGEIQAACDNAKQVMNRGQLPGADAVLDLRLA